MFRGSMPTVLVLTVGVAAVAADRLLKGLAVSGVTLGPVNGGVRFELLPNPAIAFSIGLPRSVTLVMVPIILLLLIAGGLRLLQRQQLAPAVALLVTVLAAGSNLLDRIRYGFVVDYVSLGNWFPVFNLADVVVAAGLLLAVVWLDVRRTAR